MQASTQTSAKSGRSRAGKPAPKQAAPKTTAPKQAAPKQATAASASAPGPQPQAKPDAPSQFAGKTIASVFGEMVWLLSRSPKYRDLKLSDLEWLVMPPLLLRQFKLFYAGQTPVALELHAKVSPAVAARLDAGDKKLAPPEWKSGELERLVERVELSAAELGVQPGAAGPNGPLHSTKQ